MQNLLETFDHARLFKAASVLINAITSPSGNRATVPLYIEARCPRQRPPAWAFTQDELHEAMEFLLRMGLARNDTSPRSTSGVRAGRRRG